MARGDNTTQDRNMGAGIENETDDLGAQGIAGDEDAMMEGEGGSRGGSRAGGRKTPRGGSRKRAGSRKGGAKKRAGTRKARGGSRAGSRGARKSTGRGKSRTG